MIFAAIPPHLSCRYSLYFIYFLHTPLSRFVCVCVCMYVWCVCVCVYVCVWCVCVCVCMCVGGVCVCVCVCVWGGCVCVCVCVCGVGVCVVCVRVRCVCVCVCVCVDRQACLYAILVTPAPVVTTDTVSATNDFLPEFCSDDAALWLPPTATRQHRAKYGLMAGHSPKAEAEITCLA
jgi:hypothetical protein